MEQSPGPITGWEPHVPVGDTLLRQFVCNDAEHFAAFATAGGGRVIRTEDYVAADLGRPSGYFNSTMLLRPPDEERRERLLDELERWYEREGTGEVLLWSAWPTPDLRPRGWELEGHPPLLVRPPGGALPAPSGARRVEEVRDARGVRDWEHVAVAGFPFDDVDPGEAGALADERLLEDRRVRLWVGYEGDRPVATGTLFVEHGLAQLALAATLPEARRRGFWYALVRERLLAAGDLPCAAVFSDDSRPGAEQVGFLPVLRFSLWRRPRG